MNRSIWSPFYTFYVTNEFITVNGINRKVLNTGGFIRKLNIGVLSDFTIGVINALYYRPAETITQ